MGILTSALTVATKVGSLDKNNTLGSGVGLAVAACLYVFQERLGLAESDIIAIAWAVDILMTNVLERLFPKAKDFDTEVQKRVEEVLAKVPQVEATYPVDSRETPSEVVGKSGNNVQLGRKL